MLRCAPSLLPAAALIALAAAFPASAQVQRNFPQSALRGAILFSSTPPAITLNGNDALLAPGARIHGMDNMLQMSGALAGQKYVVDYTTEMNGLVFEVWLLTPTESAVLPWPQTPAQAAAWQFDPIGQTWTIP